jgi:hypothetical protein
MSAYKPSDYLGKAKALRARRLGVHPAPARPLHPEEDPKVRGTGSGVSTVKATRKHALITTPDRLAGLEAYLEAAPRIGLDLETTGLDPRRDRIRLLTLATEGGTWLVDCFEVDPRPLFPILAEKELVIHNALFDLGFLREMGFELAEDGKVLDTMLLSQLLYGQHPQGKEDT